MEAAWSDDEHSSTAGGRQRRRERGEVEVAEAEEFIRLFHSENPAAGPPGQRLEAVRKSVAETGTYVHTPDELSYGARVAWRNSKRCIGRLYWRSLVVHDCRKVTAAHNIFDRCVEHLRSAFNDGRIRPAITVFAPAGPDGGAPRIHNEQLIRYAGHRQPDGGVLGDPQNVELTDKAFRLGWKCPEPTAFDPLPLLIETPDDGLMLFDLPEDIIREVPIRHPVYPWFAQLGLRWHAVPAISSMTLEIGGVHYPAAPFNGWYMGTEIGSRNFGDADRYDLLPKVARRLDLDTSTDRTLWKDLALAEINIAVLWSFQEAGVTMTDHHTEAHRFMIHLEREGRAGRMVPADWSWIVPPMAASTTPVFHRYYDNVDLSPNYRHNGSGQ